MIGLVSITGIIPIDAGSKYYHLHRLYYPHAILVTFCRRRILVYYYSNARLGEAQEERPFWLFPTTDGSDGNLTGPSRFWAEIEGNLSDDGLHSVL